MPVAGMNHFTVLTSDLDACKRFYTELLGLEPGFRPDLGFPGVWLYVGGQAVLHVIAGRPLPADPHGVLDHMAFTATDLPGTVAKLKARQIAYDLRRQADSFIELQDMAPSIMRNHHPRDETRPASQGPISSGPTSPGPASPERRVEPVEIV